MLSTPHKVTPPFILAFLADRFDDFQQALQTGVDINETDASGKTILAYCLDKYAKTRNIKYREITLQLLEKKADVTHESINKLLLDSDKNDSIIMLIANMRSLKEAKDISSKANYSFNIASSYRELGNKNQCFFWFHFSAIHGNPKAMNLLAKIPGGLIAQKRYFEAIYWLEKSCLSASETAHPIDTIPILFEQTRNLDPQVAFRAHMALCRIYIKFNDEQKALLHLKNAKTMFNEIASLQNIQALIELHIIAAIITSRTHESAAISEYHRAAELGSVDSAFQIVKLIKFNKSLVEKAEEKFIAFCTMAMKNALINGDENLINETKQRLHIYRSLMPQNEDYTVIFNAILNLKLDDPIKKPLFNRDEVSAAFEKIEETIKSIESKKLADLEAKEMKEEIEFKNCIAEASKLILQGSAENLIKWVVSIEMHLTDENKDHLHKKRLEAILQIYFQTSVLDTRKLINNVFIELSKYKLTPKAMEKVLKFNKYINCQNTGILIKEMQENYIPALHLFDQYWAGTFRIPGRKRVISRIVLCAKLLCLTQKISDVVDQIGIPENEVLRMRTVAQDFLDACQRPNEESLYSSRTKEDIAECQLFAMWCNYLYINSSSITFNTTHDIDVYFLKSPVICNFLTPSGTEFDKAIIAKRMKKSYENLGFTSDWISKTTNSIFSTSISSLKDADTLKKFESELKALPEKNDLINTLLDELEKAVEVSDEKQVTFAANKIILAFEYWSKAKYKYADVMSSNCLFKSYKDAEMAAQQKKLIFRIINSLLSKLENAKFLHAFLLYFFHASHNESINLLPDELDNLFLSILTTARKLYFSSDTPSITKRAVKFDQLLPMRDLVRLNLKVQKELKMLLDDIDCFEDISRLQKMMQENSIRGLHLFYLYMSNSAMPKQRVISRILLCTKILCLTRGNISEVAKKAELPEGIVQSMRIEAQNFLSLCQQSDTEEAKNLYKHRDSKDIMECSLFAEWCDDFQLQCQNQEFGDVDAYLLQATTADLLPLQDQKNFLSKKTGEGIDKSIIQKRMELAYKNLGASKKWVAEKYKQPVAIVTKSLVESKSSSDVASVKKIQQSLGVFSQIVPSVPGSLPAVSSLPVPSAPELPQPSVFPAFTAVYPQISSEESERPPAENPESQHLTRSSRTI